MIKTAQPRAKDGPNWRQVMNTILELLVIAGGVSGIFMIGYAVVYSDVIIDKIKGEK